MMQRLANPLAADRPAAAGQTATMTWEGTSWGFQALDGLPDVAESAEYAPPSGVGVGVPLLSTGQTATGYGHTLLDSLAWLWAGQEAAPIAGRRRALTAYETEVQDALVDRRDAAIRLQQVLADDLAQFEGGRAAVQAGHAVDMLDASTGGASRRTVTDAVAEFERARHRFRLALVAVGVDNGMSGADIGAALTVSRQLASRYLQEARDKWPELRPPTTARGRRRRP
jgi:hypothetical protein